MKKPKVLHNFYKSPAWLAARELKIMSVNGLCERCGAIGEEVHHIVRLNSDNVMDASVSINPENLVLLCKDCHNKEHQRFSKEMMFDDEGNPINTEMP